MTLKLLIVKTGSTYPEIVATSGDYDAWFTSVAGIAKCEVTVIDSLANALPDSTGLDAIVLTGSSRSVTQLNAKLNRFSDWIRDLGDRNVPTLGVCFGHQMMGHAFGGTIERHPGRRQFGAINASLTDAGHRDFLFRGFKTDLTVHSCHEDICTKLPESATLLASSTLTEIQAFAIGSNLRAVQFHPEVSADLLQKLHDALVARDALQPISGAYRSKVAESQGEKLLANFLEHAIDIRRKMLDSRRG